MAAPGLPEITTTTQRHRSARKMPLGPMKTKAQKQAGMHTVMGEFKRGKLHSGSKKGPQVTSRKQAIAIGLSQTGQSKYKRQEGGGVPLPPTRRPGWQWTPEQLRAKQGPATGTTSGSISTEDAQRFIKGVKDQGYKRGGRVRPQMANIPHASTPLTGQGGAGHSGQGKGHSIGNAPEFSKHSGGQSYEAEQREHWGALPKMSRKTTSPMASIDNPQGSKLLGKGTGSHSGQPSGKGIGNSSRAQRMDSGGDRQVFNPPSSTAGHNFGYAAHRRVGPLRMSGHPGAHRIGKR